MDDFWNALDISDSHLFTHSSGKGVDGYCSHCKVNGEPKENMIAMISSHEREIWKKKEGLHDCLEKHELWRISLITARMDGLQE